MKYLLKQTELFAHFAKGGQSASQKIKGRYVISALLHFVFLWINFCGLISCTRDMIDCVSLYC